MRFIGRGGDGGGNGGKFPLDLLCSWEIRGELPLGLRDLSEQGIAGGITVGGWVGKADSIVFGGNGRGRLRGQTGRQVVVGNRDIFTRRSCVVGY